MQKICKECGEFKEYCAKGLCKACYLKEWKSKNPEKVKISRKKYYQKNPEKVRKQTREGGKKYYAKNSDKVKEYKKQYRLANFDKVKEQIKKAQKKYRINHPEKIKIRLKKWRKNHPEKIEEWHRKNPEYNKEWWKDNPEKDREYHLKRNVNGIIKKGIIKQIINENILKYGIITCEKCEKECPKNFHIDHIIPISKGGTNDYDNLQVLYAHCNLTKHVDIADYRQGIEDNQLYLREAL